MYINTTALLDKHAFLNSVHPQPLTLTPYPVNTYAHKNTTALLPKHAFLNSQLATLYFLQRGGLTRGMHSFVCLCVCV